ncbi:MAG: SDR family oxidoreductase [Actinobacteria bacterium]|nr:SDR family oxidoreductase [Actinomycetota bacterium]
MEGKRASDTGAGAGIGHTSALRMAEEGVRVMLADVDEESAKKVASKLEGSSLVYSADVIRAEEIEALVQRAVEEWDGLDVMVNNAGVGVAATTLETREENHELVMDVRIRGTFLGMRCAILAMSHTAASSPPRR